MDIVVHDDFYKYFQNEFNEYPECFVMSLSKFCDKTIRYTENIAHVVCDANNYKPIASELTEIYNENSLVLIKKPTITTKPFYTSYQFSRKIKMYNLNRKNYRIVVWKINEYLPICATKLFSITLDQVYDIIYDIKKQVRMFFNNLTTKFDDNINYKNFIPANVIVFDLDDTIITADDELLENSINVLKYARQRFDLVILWSHGSDDHVKRIVKKFNLSCFFDKILCNPDCGSISYKKNLLFLYTFFPEYSFNKCVLVDDLLTNYTPEYDYIIVPNRHIHKLYIESLL